MRQQELGLVPVVTKGSRWGHGGECVRGEDRGSGSEAAAEVTCTGTRVMAASQCSGFPRGHRPWLQPLGHPPPVHRTASHLGALWCWQFKAEEWRLGDYVCKNNRNKSCFQASVCIYASQSKGIKNKHPPLFQSYVA